MSISEEEREKIEREKDEEALLYRLREESEALPEPHPTPPVEIGSEEEGTKWKVPFAGYHALGDPGYKVYVPEQGLLITVSKEDIDQKINELNENPETRIKLQGKTPEEQALVALGDIFGVEMTSGSLEELATLDIKTKVVVDNIRDPETGQVQSFSKEQIRSLNDLADENLTHEEASSYRMTRYGLSEQLKEEQITQRQEGIANLPDDTRRELASLAQQITGGTYMPRIDIRDVASSPVSPDAVSREQPSSKRELG